MTYFRRITMAACLGLLLTYGASSEAQSSAKAFGAAIKVGDIVPRCKAPVCDVAVAPAPLPGRTRVVSRRDVHDAINRAGLQAEGLRIPARKRVTRPAKTVGERELRDVIAQAVVEILPDDVKLENLGRVSKVEVPAKGFEVQARWPGAESFRRRVSIPVDLLADGVRFRTIQVAAQLVLEAEIPVAARPLERGAVVSARDIVWAKVRLDTPTNHLATQERDIVGRQLSNGLGKGMPFTARTLTRVPIIRRGQRLTVASVQGLVRVKTTGEAKQDGAVGERIRVLLMPAGRLVWAEVRGPGVAMVIP
jgi:flagella basal body P-ring formation protein FlgA